MNLEVVKLSLGGSLRVKVGKSTFGIPQGSRVAHVNRDGRALAYVLNAGHVLCLVEAGEIPMSERMQSTIAAKVFNVK
jgi:hypothetical protein